MINKCIGCYYHDTKENLCTHGRPIFIDDVCTDYQENEFVRQIRADAIDEYKQRLLEDLIPLKDKYFDTARGTSMPERYTYIKQMDTVKIIIEMVNLIAEQLKERRNGT